LIGKQDQAVAKYTIVRLNRSPNRHMGLDRSRRKRWIDDQIDDQSGPIGHHRGSLPPEFGRAVKVASE
jgi:hypothetical protein